MLLVVFELRNFGRIIFLQIYQPLKNSNVNVNNIIEIKNNVENLKENYYLGEEFCDWPIYGRESILGILRVPKEIFRADILSDYTYSHQNLKIDFRSFFALHLPGFLNFLLKSHKCQLYQLNFAWLYIQNVYYARYVEFFWIKIKLFF